MHARIFCLKQRYKTVKKKIINGARVFILGTSQNDKLFYKPNWSLNPPKEPSTMAKYQEKPQLSHKSCPKLNISSLGHGVWIFYFLFFALFVSLGSWYVFLNAAHELDFHAELCSFLQNCQAKDKYTVHQHILFQERHCTFSSQVIGKLPLKGYFSLFLSSMHNRFLL